MARKGKNKNRNKQKNKSKAKQQVQQKQQNRKQRKQTNKQKRGNRYREEWDRHWKAFNAKLAPHGLVLQEMRADGNCLFRSFADQLERNAGLHGVYRGRCIEYMRNHPDEFAPFMTDDFEGYLNEMSQHQEWGGQLELIALGRAYQVNIVVHHETEPRYEMVYPVPSQLQGTVHVSYHDESHYNSVRPLDQREKGVTNILAPDLNKKPTFVRKEKKEEEVSPKKDNKKGKKKKYEKPLKKMSKKERKKAKKLARALKNKQKSERREEKQAEVRKTLPPEDLGAIRV